MTQEKAIDYLKNYKTPIKIMEVCGTHTAAIAKSGIRQIISKNIRLVSGPGCPVCVTSSPYIDKLIELSLRPNHKVLSFGDMLNVRGEKMSLNEVRACKGCVEYFYSPLEAISLAKANPQIMFVVAAVGFETTIPAFALLVHKIVQEKIQNIKLLTALKTMPQILKIVAAQEGIDGFLCPGHVAAVIGEKPFERLCNEFGKPFVIAGFEPEHILAAVYEIALQAERQASKCVNYYKSVVSEEPQKKAQMLMEKYFEQEDASWRGIGKVEKSGLFLRKEFAEFDYGSRDISEEKAKSEIDCMCDEIIMGRKLPRECPLFMSKCTPENPIGPCMVSSEGTCLIESGSAGLNSPLPGRI